MLHELRLPAGESIALGSHRFTVERQRIRIVESACGRSARSNRQWVPGRHRLLLLMEGLFTGAEMVLVCATAKLTERARQGDRGRNRTETAASRMPRDDAHRDEPVRGPSTIIASIFSSDSGARGLLVAAITPLVILFSEIVPRVRPAARTPWRGAVSSGMRGSLYIPWSRRHPSSPASFRVPFGGVPPSQHGDPEELRLILQMSRTGTDVEAHERVMVRRAFHFGEKRSRTSSALAKVVALPEEAVCRGRRCWPPAAAIPATRYTGNGSTGSSASCTCSTRWGALRTYPSSRCCARRSSSRS